MIEVHTSGGRSGGVWATEVIMIKLRHCWVKKMSEGRVDTERQNVIDNNVTI